MRPEYEAAVDAVRFGWSLWIIAVLPALLIWIPIWKCRHNMRGFLPVGCSTLLLSTILFAVLIVFHGTRIQAAKEAHAQTEEEWSDWSQDTWLLFSPMTSVPVGIGFAAANAFVACLTIGFVVECRPKPD